MIELSNINVKFESENTRLRKERDYFRGLYETEINKVKMMTPSRDNEQLLTVGKSNKQQQQKLEDSMLQNGSEH